MQKVLGDFIHALRQAGLPISAAETLDGLKAAQLVGIEDASLLKQSLGMTLTKRLEHRIIFDDLFEQYFCALPQGQSQEQLQEQPQEQPQEQSQDGNQNAPESEQMANEADASETAATSESTETSGDSPGPTEPPTSALAQQLLAGDNAGLQISIAEAASAAGAQSMRLFTQIPMITYQVMQTLGDGELIQDLAQMDENAPQTQLLQTRRSQLQQQVRDYVEQQYLLFGQGEPQKLRAENLQKVRLTSIDHGNYKLMSELVRKAAKRLASMHSRRRRITKRGLLDVRRTISANAAFDGFMFHTKWKSTRIERPKITVICDVSGSVSRVARFLLLFLYSLQDVLPRVRSFVFSSELGEVTELFEQQEMDAALGEVMSKWANMPTNYGRALEDFQKTALGDIDNRTTVIMLGDARNNNGDGRTDIWEEVYRKSQRVLWLNPEGQFSWDSGDSIMSEYAPYCSHVETCNSLRDLNRILGSVLKHQR